MFVILPGGVGLTPNVPNFPPVDDLQGRLRADRISLTASAAIASRVPAIRYLALRGPHTWRSWYSCCRFSLPLLALVVRMMMSFSTLTFMPLSRVLRGVEWLIDRRRRDDGRS